MSAQDVDIVAEHTPRKPRIALMGEFSAGKSTLMNLLLGCDPMPVRITATRVPPVWVTHGPRSARLVGEDGTETQFDGEDLSTAPMDGCELIRFSMDSDILNLCDLIDIPGISDPNLKHETWLTLMEDVDCVIWCTHATQAWRQSEAALWEQVSQQINGPNHLVVTQFDKLRSERDQGRVMARLQAEAGEAFDGIIPISTLDAINAGMDESAWRNSGGAALIECLVAMLVGETSVAAAGQGNVNAEPLEESQAGTPSAVTPLSKASDTPCAPSGVPRMANDDQKKVVPRRVRPQTPNPERPSSDELQDVPLPAFGGRGEI